MEVAQQSPSSSNIGLGIVIGAGLGVALGTAIGAALSPTQGG